MSLQKVIDAIISATAKPGPSNFGKPNLPKMTEIECPVCGIRLLIPAHGKYLQKCPDCRMLITPAGQIVYASDEPYEEACKIAKGGTHEK